MSYNWCMKLQCQCHRSVGASIGKPGVRAATTIKTTPRYHSMVWTPGRRPCPPACHDNGRRRTPPYAHDAQVRAMACALCWRRPTAPAGRDQAPVYRDVRSQAKPALNRSLFHLDDQQGMVGEIQDRLLRLIGAEGQVELAGRCGLNWLPSPQGDVCWM